MTARKSEHTSDAEVFLLAYVNLKKNTEAFWASEVYNNEI